MVADRDRVLRAAATVFVRRPGATMAEVAQAAGISRATLHRVVPNREELIIELANTALDESERAVEAAKPEDDDAETALLRVVQALMPIADLYAFLSGEARATSAMDDDTRYEVMEERLTRLVRRGQESGDFRVDLTAEWVVDALVALVTAAGYGVAEGRLASKDAARSVTGLLMGGIHR